MVRMTTIAVIGEVVADAVLPADGVRDGVASLTVHPGGGPANTALTLARLGTHCRFGGRLSTGSLGALCRARLAESGVDLTAAVATGAPATLAIARLAEDGSATYEFYTDGTADWGWNDDELAAVVRGGPAYPALADSTESDRPASDGPRPIAPRPIAPGLTAMRLTPKAAKPTVTTAGWSRCTQAHWRWRFNRRAPRSKHFWIWSAAAPRCRSIRTYARCSSRSTSTEKGSITGPRSPT